MATAFESLTTEEKNAKFLKWLEGRESRKGQSTAKRKVVAELVKKYRPEYNKYLVAAGGTVKD